MFKNRSENGRNNLCGDRIRELRLAERWSQRELADRLQLIGLDLGKNAIQQIESGQRFVTDIELTAIAKVFQTDINTLIQ